MCILKIWNTALVLLALNLSSLRNISTSALDGKIEHFQTFRATDPIISNHDEAEVGSISSKNQSVDMGYNISATDYISPKGTNLKSHEIKKSLLRFGVDPTSLMKLKNETKFQGTKGSELDKKKTISSISSTESSTMFLPTMQSIFNIHNETQMNVNVTVPHVSHDMSGDNFSLISTKNEMPISTIDSSTPMRGRALNVSTPDLTNSLYSNITDLSDVSMNEDDEQIEDEKYIETHDATSSIHLPINLTNISKCVDNNKTYSPGENIVRGCDEKCICGEDGKIKNCMPLCITPYVRAGQANRDPLCQERNIDTQGCCAILLCADSATEPEETCLFGNETLMRGQRVEKGCAEVCVCETGGTLKCHPRCPPNETNSVLKYHDRCVALADPRDSCCTITYCDVSLGEDEIKSENSSNLAVKLNDIQVLNSTAIKLTLSSNMTNETVIEISGNNHLWRQQKLAKGGIITNLEPTQSYYVRVKEGDQTGPALRVIMPAEVIKTNITVKMDKNSCNHRGKQYKIGAEWYDDCLSICMCGEGAKVECITIECPTDFGLDVLDPHCLDWETVPPDFIPKAPNCCPQEVRCRNNGSCIYENRTYDNWSDIPSNITGCEKRCYCEMGKLSCQATCPPVSASPPPTLKCLPHPAILAKLPNDDCCSHWVCDHTAQYTSGENTTPAYFSPVAIDLNNWQQVDDNVQLNNKSLASAKPTRKPGGIDGFSYSWQNHNLPITHYPMDPGHPTLPFNGPYNPDYIPTEANIEHTTHLRDRQQEKITLSLKDKSKLKNDAKKYSDPMKPNKEVVEQQQVPHHQLSPPQQTFIGPVAPNRLPIIPNKTNENSYSPSTNPKESPLHTTDGTIIDESSHFQPPDKSGPTLFPFPPNNGGNIPPIKFNQNQFQNGNNKSPYHDTQSISQHPPIHDSNYIIPAGNTDNKVQSGDASIDNIKFNTDHSTSGKFSLDQKKSELGILQHKLVHPTNLHPGLTQLLDSPTRVYPDLHQLHQHLIHQSELPTNQIPFGYFGRPVQGSKKINSQIFTQQDGNGGTIYNIETSHIPSTPQQIEKLLAQISHHDSTDVPPQRFPIHPPISFNYPNGLPVSSPHNDFNALNLGVPHLSHPPTAQTSIQSDTQDHNLHDGFPINGAIPEFTGQLPGQSSAHGITIQAIDPLNDRTVRVVFRVSPVLVGLHGRVELRYTSDKLNSDPATWESQVFIPPNDLIETPQLEFNLDGLEPATEYNVKVTVYLRDLANSPTSQIYTVRTLDKYEKQTTLPLQIPIDAEIGIMETNSTWVKVIWKKFSEYEMQFIDGVQLRYKEHDSKVYAATPLIHRAVTSYLIENLKSATTYEIGISIIPFPGQTTELTSDKTIEVTTAVEPDPYSFDVKIEIKTVKSQDIEITWTGVPYPQDKYVNIYRAIYQSDSGKGDTSTFKIAKRDSTARTVISDLKPGTRYRLWLEIYLTNGRIKKSNVQDFVTKPGIVLSPEISHQGKLASIPLHEGDYYGPLVIVAIVASLSILSTLILLMILMRRKSSNKADISSRKSTSAYDNPSYKICEDPITIINGCNKVTEHEMSAIDLNVKAKESG